MDAALRPHRGGTVIGIESLSFKKKIALSLLLSLLFCSCTTEQPGSWRDEPRPWEPNSVAGTYRVKAHGKDGEETTLFRTAIIEDNGREVLAGRVWDPRQDAESTVCLDLSQVERLETQRMGPQAVGTSVGQMLCFTYTALALILLVGLI